MADIKPQEEQNTKPDRLSERHSYLYLDFRSHYICTDITQGSQDSVVGIKAGLSRDQIPVVASFAVPSRPAPKSSQSPVQWVQQGPYGSNAAGA
jgi:hypothetical protein